MAARLNVALVGAGLMGSFHAETLAHRLPHARLATIVDAKFAPGSLSEKMALGQLDLRSC